MPMKGCNNDPPKSQKNNDPTVNEIQIEINGCWIDVRVDVNSLWQALGLPPHNIFQSGIFNEYVHNETVGPDVEDTDHGATEPPASGALCRSVTVRMNPFCP